MKKTLILISIFIFLSTIFVGCANDNNVNQTQNNNINNNNITNNENINTTIKEAEIDPKDYVTKSSQDLSDIVIDYSNADKTSDYNTEKSAHIDLNNMTIDGDGVFIKENKITLNKAGTFVFNGTLEDGQIIVDVTKADKVQIVLNNANISNNFGSAIYVNQAEKVVITLAGGSINTIVDGTSYKDVSEDAPDAAIYSKDDLTINGSGSLTVQGNYQHAIKSIDDLIVMSGKLNITSVEEGLRGKDSVVIAGGTIDIKSSGDGIKTDNTENKGYIVIDGGSLTITSEKNGIESQKGIIINAGTFNIISKQDSIHSNGSIQINGGEFKINASDDAIHANNSLEIKDGIIIVESSYEGLEASDIVVDGGNITVFADDDGFNAAGGSDGNANPMDRFSQDNDYFIRVNGGEIYVKAGGDGIDSNGDLYFTDGLIVVDGEYGGMDPAMDINMGNVIYHGGTLVTAGMNSMLAVPNIASVPVLAVVFNNAQNSDEYISIKNESGKEVLTFKPQNKYEVIMVSSNEFSIGETYTIHQGGQYNGETRDNMYYFNGEHTGGEILLKVTLEENITTVDQNGNPTQVAKGPGGMGGRGDFDPSKMKDNGGKMKPENALEMLPIENGILRLPDGTTYEIPQDEIPKMDGTKIIFSNGVEIDLMEIKEAMKNGFKRP